MNHRCTAPSSLVAVAVAIAVLGLLASNAPNTTTKTNTVTVVTALKHNFYTRRDERSLIGPLGFPFGFLEKGHYDLTVFDFQLTPIKDTHKHNNNKKRKKNKNNNNNDGRSLAFWGGGKSAAAASTSNTKCDSATEPCLSDVLEKIDGVGFLLKQFKSELDFNQYMAYIQETGYCIFQDYLDSEKDDYGYVGDDEYRFDLDDQMFGYGGDDRYNDDRPKDYDDDISFDEKYNDDMRSRRRQQQQQQTKRQQRQLDIDEPQGYGEVIDAAENGIYLDMLPRDRWQPNSVSAAYDFQTGEAGFYFLIYQVCYKLDYQNLVQDDATDIYDIHTRFELDFHFSNLDYFGNKSYLSRGEMNLPWLFFVFSLMYAVCLYVWHANIRLIKNGKPGYFDSGDADTTLLPTIPGGAATSDGPTIYPIHYLMGFLLALKFCSLFFESVRYHYLRVAGHAAFFSAVYYTFYFLKGITLFTVVLLIGSGWSFVKPFITDREKKTIMGVLVLQVVNNIAIVFLTQETEGELSFDRWTAILHLVDILCCCAVLMPVVWQVNQLEKNMEQNQHKGNEDAQDNIGSEEESFINGQFDDGDDHVPEKEIEGRFNDEDEDDDENGATIIPDERMTAKLKLFRSFYILVIAYIYMTRIVVYLFAATLNYKHTWIPILVVELTTVAFYMAVGYLFRPVKEKSYSHVGQRKPKSQIEMPKIDPSTKVALD